jgi:hypothetical protein
MTPAPAQQQNTEPTHQSSHRDTQQSNASTDTSKFRQRPTFKARSTHLGITIRWNPEPAQNVHTTLRFGGVSWRP